MHVSFLGFVENDIEPMTHDASEIISSQIPSTWEMPIITPRYADIGDFGYIAGAYVYSEPCLQERTNTYMSGVYIRGLIAEDAIDSCGHSSCMSEKFGQVTVAGKPMRDVWVRIRYTKWNDPTYKSLFRAACK